MAALLFEEELLKHGRVAHALAEVDRMAGEIRARLDSVVKPVERVTTINKYLFEDEALSYDADRRFLSDVLLDKRGDCVGLTCIYLALGHRLQLPLVAVQAPRHVFVRYPVGKRMLSIETTHKGAFFKQKDLVRRLRISKSTIAAGVYLRPLEKTEFLSILICNIGKAYLRARNSKRGRGAFDLAASLYPKNPMPYNNRGVLLALANMHAEALVDFDRALSLDPGNAPAYANRAGTHLSMGAPEKALTDYDRSIRLAPDNVDARNQRGKLLAEQGDYRGALRDFDKALELRPQSAELLANRANVHMLSADYKKALSDYDAAIGLNPLNAGCWYHRARVYAFQAVEQAMLNSLARAIELDPRLRARARIEPCFTFWREDSDFRRVLGAGDMNGQPARHATSDSLDASNGGSQ
jgi:tetratricopeptide (TPR) repeat protein